MAPATKTDSSTATIVVLLGGHAQRLLPFVKDLYDDLVYTFVIDSRDDLGRLGNHLQGPNVHSFSLGVNQSAQTLCEEAPPKFREYLKTLGGMDASSGMGQAIAVGYHAGKRLIKAAEFKRVVRKTLLPRIHTACAGAVEAIRIVFIGSLAGGTYSGAQVPIADGLSDELLALTSATVATHSISTGGLTYEGVADDAWQNSAAAMMEQVRRCTDPERNVREIRRLRLIEFGVLGQDEALRDAYLAQVEQASLSEYIKVDQQRRGPNDALSGAYGAIQYWEAAFGSMLDVADDIAAVAHTVYGERLRESLDCEGSITAVDRIKVSHERVRLNNETVEAIVAEAVDHPVQWALAKLKAPTYRHTVVLQAMIGASEVVDLKKYATLWAASPATPAELDQRLQVQRRLMELLSELSEELAARREEAEAAENVAFGLFDKSHSSLASKGIVGFFLSIIWSGAKKFARLTSAGIEIRDLSDDLIAIRAEQAAVEQALCFVKESHAFLTGKIQRSLERFYEAGSPLGNRPAAVELFPFDDRLTELFAVVDDGEMKFLDWLRRSVSHATLFGLAKVCGASAPEIEEIARQIVYSRAYATPAVPWGGRRRADRGHCVHVLPPLDAEVEKLVVKAVKKLNSDTLIAVADKAPAIVNIVRIEMRVVRELNDMLTDPYKLGLTEAVNSPCPLRYFPNGLQPLHKFGIFDFVKSTAKENPQCYFSFDC